MIPEFRNSGKGGWMLIDAQSALDNLSLSMKVQTSLQRQSLNEAESVAENLLEGTEENTAKVQGRNDSLGKVIDLIA